MNLSPCRTRNNPYIIMQGGKPVPLHQGPQKNTGVSPVNNTINYNLNLNSNGYQLPHTAQKMSNTPMSTYCNMGNIPQHGSNKNNININMNTTNPNNSNNMGGHVNINVTNNMNAKNNMTKPGKENIYGNVHQSQIMVNKVVYPDNNCVRTSDPSSNQVGNKHTRNSSMQLSNIQNNLNKEKHYTPAHDSRTPLGQNRNITNFGFGYPMPSQICMQAPINKQPQSGNYQSNATAPKNISINMSNVAQIQNNVITNLNTNINNINNATNNSNNKLSKPPLSPKNSNNMAANANNANINGINSTYGNRRGSIEGNIEIGEDCSRVTNTNSKNTHTINNTNRYPSFLNRTKQLTTNSQTIEQPESQPRTNLTNSNYNNSINQHPNLPLPANAYISRHDQKQQQKNNSEFCGCGKLGTHYWNAMAFCSQCAVNKMMQGYQMQPMPHPSTQLNTNNSQDTSKDTKPDNQNISSSNTKRLILDKLKIVSPTSTNENRNIHTNFHEKQMRIQNIEVCQSQYQQPVLTASAVSEASQPFGSSIAQNVGNQISVDEFVTRLGVERNRLVELQLQYKMETRLIDQQLKNLVSSPNNKQSTQKTQKITIQSATQCLKSLYRDRKQQIKQHYQNIKNALKLSIQNDLQQLERMERVQLDELTRLNNDSKSYELPELSPRAMAQEIKGEITTKIELLESDIMTLCTIEKELSNSININKSYASNGSNNSKNSNKQKNQIKIPQQYLQIYKQIKSKSIYGKKNQGDNTLSISAISAKSAKSNSSSKQITIDQYIQNAIKSAVWKLPGNQINKQVYSAETYRYMASSPLRININIKQKGKHLDQVIERPQLEEDKYLSVKERDIRSTKGNSGRPSDLTSNSSRNSSEINQNTKNAENITNTCHSKLKNNTNNVSNLINNINMDSTKNANGNILFSFEHKL